MQCCWNHLDGLVLMAVPKHLAFIIDWTVVFTLLPQHNVWFWDPIAGYLLSCCTLVPKSENKTEIFRIMEFSPLFCGKEWFIINSHNSTRQDAYCCNGLTGCVFPDFLLLINIFFDREAAPCHIDQKYFGDIWNALGGCWTWQVVYSISNYFHYCNKK